MDFENKSQAPVTLADIACELGVSKSTVSRVVNCKGRIGPETRKRVQEMIAACNYVPNPVAKGLVLKRSYNIALVVPKDADSGEVPFFQNLILNTAEAVYKCGFDAILVVESNSDVTPLRRLIVNRKVDGVILTRIEENDEAVKLLQKEKIPFVVIGTSRDESLCQVDSDQTAGCYEMTKFMISKGCRNVALLCGNKKHLVNGTRFKGFVYACNEAGINLEKDCTVVWDADEIGLTGILPELMKENPQCLVCMDDVICVNVLKWLKMNDYEVPTDIQVISFYDNPVLENNTPPVTALNVNVFKLSQRASRLLVNLIEGKEVPSRTQVDYELRIRESFR